MAHLAIDLMVRFHHPKLIAQGETINITAAAVIASGLLASAPLFALGIFLIGLGGGLFAHGTLTATMQMAPPEQTGLAMGAWGAVQATAAGVGMACGGLLRDGMAMVSNRALRVETPEESQAVLRGVLDNQAGAARDIVILNAGAALYAANVAPTIKEGIALARQAIESGAAKQKLEQFVTFTQKAGGAA